MIAHVSLPARDPRATAQLLAQLIDGETFDFPVVPGAAIAVARDGSGLAIEVYPQDMAHHPGTGTVDPRVTVAGPQAMPWEDQIRPDGAQVRASAFHAAITTALDEDAVLALARAAGLRALGCERGGVFRVIEVWLDNTILIEVLTRPEAARYQAFMNPRGCAAMFGPALASAAAR
ncbi:MAG: hypothetical protein JNM90_15355 [Burkholderiales bacterium]|nr:hypothetical protein [Burkholderiales bacterium]